MQADLISIEVILLEDMLDCRDQLIGELATTVTRQQRIEGVTAALPAAGDKNRARAYDWEDIEVRTCTKLLYNNFFLAKLLLLLLVALASSFKVAVAAGSACYCSMQQLVLLTCAEQLLLLLRVAPASSACYTCVNDWCCFVS
jgi:hypothetical protein